MSTRIEAFVDPTCPYCYMLQSSLAEVSTGGGMEIAWRFVPWTSRRGGTGRAVAAEAAMREAAHRATWPAIQARAARDFALQLGQPGCDTDPRPACAALLHVRDTAPARVDAVLEAVFATHFGRDVDREPDAPGIEDPAVLARLLAGAGVATAGLAAALAPASGEPRLAREREAAEREGLGAVPALRVGGHLLVGAQPPAVLRGALANAAGDPLAVTTAIPPDLRQVIAQARRGAQGAADAADDDARLGSRTQSAGGPR